MALQNFVDKVGPVASAAWLNMVDILSTTVFGNAATKAAARTALCTDAPLEVVNGGTGQRTPVVVTYLPNRQDGNYTFGLADSGACITKFAGTANTWTIPSNAAVPFPLGTVIMMLQISGVLTTLNNGSETLYWLPTLNTGTRTLSGGTLAFLYKMSTDTWTLTSFGGVT